MKITEKVVTLNGSPWTFAYDWDAQIQAEKTLGVNMMMPSGTPSEIIRLIAYARLLKHHPSITLDEVSRLLPTNMDAIGSVLHEIGDYQDDSDETDPLPKLVTTDEKVA